jgi:hypothetical protein
MSEVGSYYPNIPNVPGVPPILRNPLAPIPLPPLLTSDTVSSAAAYGTQQWGLFFNGSPVIAADNVVAFEFKQDWVLADYQIEQRGFETYDKVQRPYDVRLTFSRGGSESRRAAFLASVQAIVNDTKLYDASMPEYTWTDMNITHYDLKRTATDGVGLMIINLYLLQIRADVTEQYTNTSTASGVSSPANPTATQDPGAEAFQNNGVLQPFDVQTLQPPSSASFPGATGIASDSAVTAPAALSPNAPLVTSVPVMTPANQAGDFHFGTAPSLLDGSPAQPIQAATESTYTLDQFSGGTNLYNPSDKTTTLIPAGQAPQSLGFQ